MTDYLTKPSPARQPNHNGFVLSEMVVVVFIVAMFALLAMLNLSGMIGASSFKNQAHELSNALKMAVNAAAQSDRKYELILDFTEKTYLLREITSTLDAEILEDEIILTGQFNDDFQLSYVMFDDGVFANEGKAFFRCSRNGWQATGKIVLLDSEANEYTILINKLNRQIKLFNGDVDFLEPKSKDEMQF